MALREINFAGLSGKPQLRRPEPRQSSSTRKPGRSATSRGGARGYLEVRANLALGSPKGVFLPTRAPTTLRASSGTTIAGRARARGPRHVAVANVGGYAATVSPPRIRPTGAATDRRQPSPRPHRSHAWPHARPAAACVRRCGQFTVHAPIPADVRDEERPTTCA